MFLKCALLLHDIKLKQQPKSCLQEILQQSKSGRESTAHRLDFSWPMENTTGSAQHCLAQLDSHKQSLRSCWCTLHTCLHRCYALQMASYTPGPAKAMCCTLWGGHDPLAVARWWRHWQLILAEGTKDPHATAAVAREALRLSNILPNTCLPVFYGFLQIWVGIGILLTAVHCCWKFKIATANKSSCGLSWFWMKNELFVCVCVCGKWTNLPTFRRSTYCHEKNQT